MIGKEFLRFIDRHQPVPAWKFIETWPKGYAGGASARDDSEDQTQHPQQPWHATLIDAIAIIRQAGYGVRIGGDGDDERSDVMRQIGPNGGRRPSPAERDDAGTADLRLLAHAAFGVYGCTPGSRHRAGGLGKPAVIQKPGLASAACPRWHPSWTDLLQDPVLARSRR
jgi:hypothetical protein